MIIPLLMVELVRKSSDTSNCLLSVQMRVLLRGKKRGYRLSREGVSR